MWSVSMFHQPALFRTNDTPNEAPAHKHSLSTAYWASVDKKPTTKAM
eukprot:CAMPEP_0168605288 /NCGR_PEP_ID=MMETSP0420-20121227/15868_1 /TAXON_ID=498008 /ORGANISM="Pessonella sp." /LENGTH=46 /DNA_ID= /DNA_START= /DNA_END= /DNA_ORIENTATION=